MSLVESAEVQVINCRQLSVESGPTHAFFPVMYHSSILEVLKDSAAVWQLDARRRGRDWACDSSLELVWATLPYLQANGEGLS